MIVMAATTFYLVMVYVDVRWIYFNACGGNSFRKSTTMCTQMKVLHWLDRGDVPVFNYEDVNHAIKPRRMPIASRVNDMAVG